MESKHCIMCNFEKHINNSYKNHTASKDCNSKRVFKRYYENKVEMSKQGNSFYEKKKDY